VWAAVLFLLSAQRVIVTPAWLPYADKVGHMGLYGVMGALLARGRWRSGSRVAPWILVLLGVLFGASDEFHQMFVPGRDPSLGDLTADIIGTAIGYGGFFLLMRRWPAAYGRARTHPTTTPGQDPHE
jgi:VanZ family protein